MFFVKYSKSRQEFDIKATIDVLKSIYAFMQAFRVLILLGGLVICWSSRIRANK